MYLSLWAVDWTIDICELFIRPKTLGRVDNEVKGIGEYSKRIPTGILSCEAIFMGTEGDNDNDATDDPAFPKSLMFDLKPYFSG